LSIDAARKATYEINRRGATWERLLENLEFISQLRKEGQLRFVQMNMVVQRNNWRQVGQFIQMAERYGFDFVFLNPLGNRGHMTRGQLHRKVIHIKHVVDPVLEHYAFIDELNKQIAKYLHSETPQVFFGSLMKFHQPSRAIKMQ